MQKMVGVGLLAAILVCGLYVKHATTVPTETQERLAEMQAQAEIERLKIRQEEEKRKTAVVLAELRRRELHTKQDAAVRQAQPVMTARIILLSSWYLLPVVSFGIVVIGAGVYLVFKQTPFEAVGVRTFVSRKQAAQLAAQSLVVSGLSEAARIAAYRETIGAQRFAQGVTLFSTLKNAWRGPGMSQALPEPHLTDPAVVSLPSFSELLLTNAFQAGKVLIGYHTTQPVYMEVTDFVSCGFGGGSGSGKTSKLRFLLAQLAIQGVRLHILDAHSGDPQSLVSSLGDLTRLPNVTAYLALECKETIDFFMRDLTEAIQSPHEKTPVVYVIDELLPVLDVAPQAEKFIQKVACEGRKYQRFGVFASQIWPASLFKNSGSSTRDALMLKMAAQMPIEQARILFKSKEKAATVEKLALPEMFASSMKFSGVVRVPFCSKNDMDTLAAAHLPSGVSDEPAAQPERLNTPEQGSEHPTEQSTVQTQMFSLNISLNKLAKLSGVPKSSLSVFLNGGKLSDEYKQAIQDTLNTLKKQSETA